MRPPPSTLSWYAIITLISSVFLIEESAAQAIESCVITDTSCPCTIRSSSGSCMRYQGDGYCLMENCNDGYKCDCLAYEQCSISACAKYTTLDGVIPSFENPFRCQLTPNAGNCTAFSSFIDTIGATDYAVAEVSQTIATTNEDVIGSLQDVITIQGEKMKIDAALQELDQFANNVTEEERLPVEKEATLVINLIEASQQEAVIIQKHSMEASNAAAKATLNRRIAYEKESQAMAREAEEAVEAAKPENQPVCNPCVELKKEAERLRNERREAVVLAGTWARRARDEKENGSSRRMNVENMKQNAGQARGRALGQVDKILNRLRPSSGTGTGTGDTGGTGTGSADTGGTGTGGADTGGTGTGGADTGGTGTGGADTGGTGTGGADTGGTGTGGADTGGTGTGGADTGGTGTGGADTGSTGTGGTDTGGTDSTATMNTSGTTNGVSEPIGNNGIGSGSN